MYDLFSADKTLLIYHKYRLMESTDESLISLQRKQSEPKPLLRGREHKAARLGLLTSLQRPKPGLISENGRPDPGCLRTPHGPISFWVRGKKLLLNYYMYILYILTPKVSLPIAMVVLVNFHTFGFIDEKHIYRYSHYSLYIIYNKFTIFSSVIT